MKRFIITSLIVMVGIVAYAQSGIQIIPVNVDQNTPVKLSEIAEKITPITLEITENSLISNVMQVELCGDNIVVVDYKGPRILLFNKQGKYIRQISSKGKGPGEYVYLQGIATDWKNSLIYIAATNKILCFNFNGKLIKKSPTIQHPEYIDFFNGKLYVFSARIGQSFGNNRFRNQTMMFQMDHNWKITDSIEVKSVILNKLVGTINPRMHYLSINENKIFVYYPVLVPEPMVRDTLYEIKGKSLIPSIKLKFSDENKTSNNNRNKSLLSIYATSRFVVAEYQNNRGPYRFCYDRTRKIGINMKDGFMDDVHKTGIVDIKVIDTNDGIFYYLHTPEETANQETEPNPVLYLGTFKK